MKIIRLMLVVLYCAMQCTSAAAAQEGEASYYADSLNGRKTASGALYDCVFCVEHQRRWQEKK